MDGARDDRGIGSDPNKHEDEKMEGMEEDNVAVHDGEEVSPDVTSRASLRAAINRLSEGLQFLI